MNVNIGIGIHGALMMEPTPIYTPATAYAVPRPVTYHAGPWSYDDDDEPREKWERKWRKQHHHHGRHGDADED